MLKFESSGFVLEERDCDILLPISSKPGKQCPGTEAVLRLFPSLKEQLDEIQWRQLDPGSVTEMKPVSGVRFHAWVTQVRPYDNIMLVNYIVKAIEGLSQRLRESDCKWAVAPITQKDHFPQETLQKMIEGIMGEHPADIIFYME